MLIAFIMVMNSYSNSKLCAICTLYYLSPLASPNISDASGTMKISLFIYLFFIQCPYSWIQAASGSTCGIVGDNCPY